MKNDASGPNFDKRTLIGQEALQCLGGHYLRGAAGATPDCRNGAAFRPGHVEWQPQHIDHPSRAMVWAAYSHISEKQVCAGRYRSPTLPGGRPAKADELQLTTYLAELKSLPSALFWPNHHGLTPRLANWTVPKPIAIMSRLVWGEDCRNVRHYDCLGLLGFVLSKLNVKMAGQFTVPMYEQSHRTEACKKTDAAWPGDIVTRHSEHIGILADANTVVEASEGPIGVVANPYDASSNSWTRRGRIRDKDL